MLSRKELTKLRKSSTISKYDRKTRTPMEELDEDKFVSLFTKATVKNWRGLSLSHLETLVLLGMGDHPADTEVEWSDTNAEYLVSTSTEFDQWLNEVVFDLDNFRRDGEK